MMRHALALAIRYLLYHRLRTALLVICVAISLFLPLAVHGLTRYYQHVMIERAAATPMIVGAAGSPNDLALSALYFKGRVAQTITMKQTREIQESGLALAVPMYVRYTARQTRIVGTTLDYFSFRKLRPAAGTLPLVLGDAVLGAEAARKLGLKPGDTLLSDYEKLYDISASYPLLMHVAGVLEETRGPDDQAVFVDIRTAWIIEGIGHGHQSAQDVADPDLLLGASAGNVVLGGGVVEYNEVTPKNLATYHFHGEPDTFPVSSIIAIPPDDRSATILKARYRASTQLQAIIPLNVVGDIMDIVFRIQRFFDGIFALVLISTGLFLVLVMWLSLRIRRREFQTLHKLGCARATVFAIAMAELGLVLLASALTAGAALAGVFAYVVHRGL